MKKVLFLVPHLSTGGMPQYTYDLMRKIKDDLDIYCVEYSMISHHFVVQRNRITNLLGDRFFCLGENKNELLEIINKIKPDIVHLQEIPEYFVDRDIASKLYSEDRNYLIVETSHDSSFSVSNKLFFPDHFALISQYQKNEFSKLGIPIDFIEADIEYKERQDRTVGLHKLGLDPNLKHVVNVGLFTPRKNQAEAIEYARALEGQPIQFHFIGNQADNFADYWQPILQNLPSNVKIWGERSDVEDFYSCMDMMLFTSRGNGNDKETSPLVIRESIGHHLPALIFNLPVYLGMYDRYETISYMDFDNPFNNVKLICDVLRLDYPEMNKEEEENHHKIKAVQFLLNGNYPKQEQSVQNLFTLERYGIGYERHYNDVYKDLPPASKSSRPHDVSMELKPNSLTPAHYGCYDSFRTAVLSEFDSDLDYFLVFEGDAKIQNNEVFMSKLNEAIRLIDKHNLDYVSFGGIYDLEFGVLQSRMVEEMTEDFFVCDKIIGCQCLLFPQKSRKKIKEILRTEPWDALDIYLNNVSAKHRLRVGVSQKTLVTQYDGISTIDSVVKQFKEFSI
jgi:glycosyltransferase involved in cell wall biosynthesis